MNELTGAGLTIASVRACSALVLAPTTGATTFSPSTVVVDMSIPDAILAACS